MFCFQSSYAFLLNSRRPPMVRGGWLFQLFPYVFPQTVLALKGSNGVDKGALKPLPRPWRCRAAYFLVKYSTWWHLPSKTHSKVDKLKELLDSAWEVFNFLASRLASGLAWPPGWPWPRMAKAEGGQGSTSQRKNRKRKVLRIEFSIVEHLSGPQERFFSRFRRFQSISLY